jgi:hypothetical protein
MERGTLEEVRKVAKEMQPLLGTVVQSMIYAPKNLCSERMRCEGRAVRLLKVADEEDLYVSNYGTFAILSPCSFGGNHHHVLAVDEEALVRVPFKRLLISLRLMMLQIAFLQLLEPKN